MFFQEISANHSQVIENPQTEGQQCHIVEIDAQPVTDIDQ